MIFGTVGTHTAPFDRLVRALDAYALESSEDVLLQIGTGIYEPKHARWFRMTTSEHMAACFRDASIVVTHAADSLLEAIRASKPVIAVPRQHRFGEVIDDHQLELARTVAASAGIIVVEEIADLRTALASAVTTPGSSPGISASALIAALRTSILELK